MTMLDFAKIRQDFPILQQTNRGKTMIYLDSAASAQKPRQVVDAIANFYYRDYANIHRGIYELSERATQIYESARQTIKEFIHAKHNDEIIFVRGTTEGINLIAQTYGRSRWQAGDEVILSVMEHHSNIVPWYLLKEQIGIVLKIIPMNDSGEMDIDAYQQLFSPRTKMAAFTHASNVLGTINPIKQMIAIAHAHKVPVLVDGAQAAPHMPIHMQDLDCDFYVFSAHKLYGPTGIGVLYGKQALLNDLPPYQGGGDMIETVSFEKVTYAKLPHLLEAGTPDIAGVIGLKAAIDYIKQMGIEHIFAHEQQLLQNAQQQLLAIPGLHLLGNAPQKLGVMSFVIDNIHPHDIGTVLDHAGIAVRAGHHCAMPLMKRLNVSATVRASLGLYNQTSDIDALIEGIHAAKRLLS
jgi:cysteine desulfurase / selenocysteine lyase